MFLTQIEADLLPRNLVLPSTVLSSLDQLSILNDMKIIFTFSVWNRIENLCRDQRVKEFITILVSLNRRIRFCVVNQTITYAKCIFTLSKHNVYMSFGQDFKIESTSKYKKKPSKSDYIVLQLPVSWLCADITLNLGLERHVKLSLATVSHSRHISLVSIYRESRG